MEGYATIEAHLLDFSKPFDCSLLDQIIEIAMDSNHTNRKAANEFLMRIKENPNIWKRADSILEMSKLPATKFFGLQVLGEAINTHWKVIPADQREGIRNYVVTKIIAISNSDEATQENASFLPRLNLVLVQILKQDWPHNWPTFITDIVNSSKASESLCENNMKVLKLLSEEVFDYSKDSMTTVKIKTLKESLNDEFSQIFQLCEFILEASTKESLLRVTLETLQRFLTWIPLGYIFETNIVNGLIAKFFPTLKFRTITVDCLTEIASLSPVDIPEGYKHNMLLLLVNLIMSLAELLPREQDLKQLYNDGTYEFQEFIARLAVFLGTYLKSYLQLFDKDGAIVHESTVLESLYYMIRISEVDDEQVFKICLDFWHQFTKDLIDEWKQSASSGSLQSISFSGASSMAITSMNNPSNGNGSANNLRLKHVVYDGILHSLRIICIDRMAMPEEVIVVEHDNGEIQRELTRDTDVIAQYKLMRDTICFLTNLNYEDTEAIMLEKLDIQVSHRFSWQGLNTLCWAIGSISGAMGELDEKRFLVSVIKDLLRLCEDQRGKDNKAVVAKNIMYIVGQYPRFLKNHWKFLKTVVNKLFEFMHEQHPGVQDMACDTFLKIAQKCKRKFMTPQVDDPQLFILTLINDLDKHVADLLPHQVQSFYESVGTMLSDQGGHIVRIARNDVILLLMKSQNDKWKSFMSKGQQNVQELLQPETVKELAKILRINTRVCVASGAVFIHQLSTIYTDVLNVYRLYSEEIIRACEAQGPVATRLFLYKQMRHVKAEILDMLTAYIEVFQDYKEGQDTITESRKLFLDQFMPMLIPEMYKDYHSSPVNARDSKVLTLFASSVSVFKEFLTPEIPNIMNAIFEKTLEMITANMVDYPDHRIAFFNFLHEANQHCFYGLFSIPQEHWRSVIDAIVFAIGHTERNISETGLEILLALLQNISREQEFAQSFYSTFLIMLVQNIFMVMTDRLHKSGFKLQASILKFFFQLVQSGQVKAPLSSDQGRDNLDFFREHVVYLLQKTFPNVTKVKTEQFVLELSDTSLDLNAFKQHLRDFLISIKEFETEDNSDLYMEETEAQLAIQREEQMIYMQSIPGLVKPSDVVEDTNAE